MAAENKEVILITQYAYLYGLIDPCDNLTHYIGQTTDLKNRLQRHISNPGSNPVFVAWVKELRELGLRPIMVVLACVSLERVSFEEANMIQLGLKLGLPLLNTQTKMYDIDPVYVNNLEDNATDYLSFLD